MNVAEINTRRRYDLYLTTSADSAGDPRWPEKPTLRGTPRQILAAIRECRRVNSGMFASKTIDPRTGEYLREHDIWSAISAAEHGV